MILDDIVAAKLRELAVLKILFPFSELKAMVRRAPPTRDFIGAISGRQCAIIAEIKKRSPSRGLLAHGFNPRRLASVYETNGAAAISILTERRFFGGDAAHVVIVREAVSLPLLRKDFIIDPYQIHEARAIGADAVLLIAGLLDRRKLRRFITLAGELGLASLVEVHSRRELDKALAAGAGLIGINNRDLRTFTTDLQVSLEIAPHVPSGTVVVSESGIISRKDIEILMEAGIHAFLIGEVLMRSEDAGGKLKEFLGS